jgi:hypothetical protein
MQVGGVDITTIDLDNSDFVLPEVVQGRYLNADGDIYAYNCAGNDDTTTEEVVYNLKAEVAARMQLTGATDYILHITGDGSDKGQRHRIACVKEYQANRKDKPKPKNLAFARKYIQEHMNSEAHYDQEADDGLAQFQQTFIDKGESHLSVLDSTDKDLRMVAGLHLDPYTHKIIEVEGYGSCWYDLEKSKVLGWGTSFFWHQLLMGDTADNIPGLPAFGKELSASIWPTAPLTEQIRRTTELTMPSGKQLSEKQYEAAKAKVQELRDTFKQKPAGAKAAYDYLEGCTTDAEAFELVIKAYESYYGTGTLDFTDWRDNNYKRTARSMILEQAILLWMRTYKGVADVQRFLRSINGEVQE